MEFAELLVNKLYKTIKRDMNIPYDPVRHGGSRFSLVGPVLRFTLEKNPVFLYWTQAPTTGLGSVSSPPPLKDKRERKSSLVQRSVSPEDRGAARLFELTLVGTLC